MTSDTRHLALLYARHADRARRYARAIVRDEHEAEDVVHDAFVRTLEALPDFEDRGVPIEAWLLRIVRNVALTRVQRACRVCVGVPPAEVPAPPVAVAGSGTLDGWLGDLPHAQREVLVLRFALDLSPTEAAAALDRTPEAVRQLQYRALATLRRRATPTPRDPSARA